jgi:hypothetical protein
MNIKLLIKGAALLGVLLLASCNNIFNPSEVSSGKTGEGTLNITLGNGVEGARTFLPSKNGIDHYKLTITPGNTEVTINTGDSTSVNLSPGEYTITAEAYADDGSGMQVAAQGSTSATVTEGQSTPVSIALRAVTSEGGTGTLEWSVTGEWDTVLSWGQASFYAYDGLSQSFSLPMDSIYIYSGNSSGTATDIPAGEYLLRLELSNNGGKSIFFHDVVHIAPGLTTHADYTVTAADFGNFTTISGTAEYTIDDISQSNYQLIIYRDPERNSSALGQVMISNDTYTLMIPKPERDVTLYIFIRDNNNYQQYFIRSIDIEAGTETVSENVSLHRTTTIVSGTLTLVNLSSQSYGWLYIVDASSDDELGATYISPLTDDNSWSIDIDHSSSARTAYIRFFSDRGYPGLLIERFTPSFEIPGNVSPVSGIDYTIDLAANPSIWGKVNLTGGPITNPTVTAYASNDTPLSGPVPVENGTFRIPLTTSYHGPYYLRFSARVNGSEKNKVIRNFPRNSLDSFNNSDIRIDLGTVDMSISRITVSGTVTLVVDGSPYRGPLYFNLYSPGHYPGETEWLGGTERQTNSAGTTSWAISMDGLAPPLTLTLEIYADDLNMTVHTRQIIVENVDVTVPDIIMNLQLDTSTGTVQGRTLGIENSAGLIDRFINSEAELNAATVYGGMSINPDGTVSIVSSGVSSAYLAVQILESRDENSITVTIYCSSAPVTVPFTDLVIDLSTMPHFTVTVNFDH